MRPIGRFLVDACDECMQSEFRVQRMVEREREREAEVRRG